MRASGKNAERGLQQTITGYLGLRPEAMQLEQFLFEDSRHLNNNGCKKTRRAG
jgi:hypothetical protein